MIHKICQCEMVEHLGKSHLLLFNNILYKLALIDVFILLIIQFSIAKNYFIQDRFMSCL